MTRKKNGAPAATKAGNRDKAAASFARRCEDAVRRHYYGVVNPKGFLDRSISLRILRLLPPVIDGCLYDVEAIGGLPHHDPRMLKLTREASTAVDRLLKYVRKDTEAIYRSLGESEAEAARIADGVADISVFIAQLLQLICGYAIEREDEWRLKELIRVVESLVTEDAQKSKEEAVRRFCADRLRSWHVDGVEEAVRQGIQPCDLKIVKPIIGEGENPAKAALRAI